MVLGSWFLVLGSWLFGFGEALAFDAECADRVGEVDQVERCAVDEKRVEDERMDRGNQQSVAPGVVDQGEVAQCGECESHVSFLLLVRGSLFLVPGL